MVRTSQEMQVELRERMRGGAGTITIKSLFQPSELGGKARLVAEVTIPPGGSIGMHQHDGEEEIFYFLAGEGEVDDNGTTRRVGAGDAMLTGGGAGHSVKNTGSGPLVLMAVILLYV